MGVRNWGLEGRGKAGTEGGVLSWGSDPSEELERSPVKTGVSHLEDLQSCPVDHREVWEENPICRGRS